MNRNRSIGTALAVLVCTLVVVSSVFAGSSASKSDSAKDSTSSPVVRNSEADNMRLQGEQRFRANCGRCHATPQKFPPRMMATVLRHMRVRATITDQDMRLVLFYMTQ